MLFKICVFMVFKVAEIWHSTDCIKRNFLLCLAYSYRTVLICAHLLCTVLNLVVFEINLVYLLLFQPWINIFQTFNYFEIHLKSSAIVSHRFKLSRRCGLHCCRNKIFILSSVRCIYKLSKVALQKWSFMHYWFNVSK